MIDKEIVRFMASFFAEKEAWISPDIEIPDDSGGFNFVHKEEVSGLVVFGKNYPLHNKDVSLDDHRNLWRYLKNIKSFGTVFPDQDKIKHYHINHNQSETQRVTSQSGVNATINTFLSDMADKHKKDKEALCVQVCNNNIELYEVEDDGHNNYLNLIETITG